MIPIAYMFLKNNILSYVSWKIIVNGRSLAFPKKHKICALLLDQQIVVSKPERPHTSKKLLRKEK